MSTRSERELAWMGAMLVGAGLVFGYAAAGIAGAIILAIVLLVAGAAVRMLGGWRELQQMKRDTDEMAALHFISAELATVGPGVPTSPTVDELLDVQWLEIGLDVVPCDGVPGFVGGAWRPIAVGLELIDEPETVIHAGFPKGQAFIESYTVDGSTPSPSFEEANRPILGVRRLVLIAGVPHGTRRLRVTYRPYADAGVIELSPAGGAEPSGDRVPRPSMPPEPSQRAELDLPVGRPED